MHAPTCSCAGADRSLTVYPLCSCSSHACYSVTPMLAHGHALPASTPASVCVVSTLQACQHLLCSLVLLNRSLKLLLETQTASKPVSVQLGWRAITATPASSICYLLAVDHAPPAYRLATFERFQKCTHTHAASRNLFFHLRILAGCSRYASNHACSSRCLPCLYTHRAAAQGRLAAPQADQARTRLPWCVGRVLTPMFFFWHCARLR